MTCHWNVDHTHTICLYINSHFLSLSVTTNCYKPEILAMANEVVFVCNELPKDVYITAAFIKKPVKGTGEDVLKSVCTKEFWQDYAQLLNVRDITFANRSGKYTPVLMCIRFMDPVPRDIAILNLRDTDLFQTSKEMAAINCSSDFCIHLWHSIGMEVTTLDFYTGESFCYKKPKHVRQLSMVPNPTENLLTDIDEHVGDIDAKLS